jgi:hypothetical protein
MFFSSNGLHNFSFSSFAVQPGASVAMRLRQQPIIAQAGEGIIFELGMLDKGSFVAELDNHTVIYAALVSSTPGGAVISCESESDLCAASKSQNGFVRFFLNINQAGTSFVLSFRGEFCGSGACLEQVIHSNLFTVLSGAPSRLLIYAQPSSLESQMHMDPTPKTSIADAFGNMLSEHVPDSHLSLIPSFKVGCDSILVQRWCDRAKCKQKCDLCPNSTPESMSTTHEDGSMLECCAVTETLRSPIFCIRRRPDFSMTVSAGGPIFCFVVLLKSL